MSNSLCTEAPEQLQAQFFEKSALQFGSQISLRGVTQSLGLIERTLPDKPNSKLQNVTGIPAGA